LNLFLRKLVRLIRPTSPTRESDGHREGERLETWPGRNVENYMNAICRH
jgi:hypothetical protein